eukprot:14835986-Alexandrium_andersonii.AAC.1
MGALRCVSKRYQTCVRDKVLPDNTAHEWAALLAKHRNQLMHALVGNGTTKHGTSFADEASPAAT